MSNFKYSIIILIFVLAGCGGGGGGDNNNPPSYHTISVTVSGLAGEGLILQNNSGDDLAVSADGFFSFATSLQNHSNYLVTISVQPAVPEQTCSVTNGSGTVSGSDINNVLVNCQVNPFPELFDTFAGYSNNIYVDDTGDDINGDGSLANPYATLTKAAQLATPGTRINMAVGNYSEGMIIADLRGTPNAPIAIVGAGNTVIDGGVGQGLRLSKPAYLVLDGVTITGAANGLNIDDGGEYSNASAAEYIIIKNSFFSSSGTGNNDALKASGVNHLIIADSQFSSVGTGSSAIDLVGCHNVVISHNILSDSPTSGVQTKGGSSDVLIHGNRFVDMPVTGARAINAGGSTSLSLFRPPLVAYATDPTIENFEASRITMLSNIFENVSNVVSFTGCVDCVFANNTIIDPGWYIVRILQETLSDGTYVFAESQNGYFLNNIVRYSTVTTPVVVNIGSNTQPATFTFDNNLWWATNQLGSYATSLTAPIPPETASLYQLDPLFVNSASDFHIGANSPVLGMGTNEVPGRIGLDFDNAAYTKPPAMGAYEGP